MHAAWTYITSIHNMIMSVMIIECNNVEGRGMLSGHEQVLFSSKYGAKDCCLQKQRKQDN